MLGCHEDATQHDEDDAECEGRFDPYFCFGVGIAGELVDRGESILNGLVYKALLGDVALELGVKLLEPALNDDFGDVRLYRRRASTQPRGR
jgi:hypothetical protein